MGGKTAVLCCLRSQTSPTDKEKGLPMIESLLPRASSPVSLCAMQLGGGGGGGAEIGSEGGVDHGHIGGGGGIRGGSGPWTQWHEPCPSKFVKKLLQMDANLQNSLKFSIVKISRYTVVIFM